MTLRITRPFTPVQVEIAEGIVAGLSYREIAREVGRRRHGRKPISENTVKSHIRAMVSKIEGRGGIPARAAISIVWKA